MIYTVAEVAVAPFDAIQPFAVLVIGSFITKVEDTAQRFLKILRAARMLLH